MNHTPDPLRSPRYGMTEMAQILGLPPSTVRRWVLENEDDGYRPVMASFLELVEMHMVAVLLDAGAKRRGLRAKVREAMTMSNPRERLKFLIDGVDLWNVQDEVVTHLGARGQLGLYGIVMAVSDCVDIDPRGVVSALYPAGRERGIVMLPGVAGGRPLIGEKLIPTWALAGRVKSGDSAKDVAGEFGISVAEVEEALAYENSLRKAA